MCWRSSGCRSGSLHAFGDEFSLRRRKADQQTTQHAKKRCIKHEPWSASGGELGQEAGQLQTRAHSLHNT